MFASKSQQVSQVSPACLWLFRFLSLVFCCDFLPFLSLTFPCYLTVTGIHWYFFPCILLFFVVERCTESFNVLSARKGRWWQQQQPLLFNISPSSSSLPTLPYLLSAVFCFALFSAMSTTKSRFSAVEFLIQSLSLASKPFLHHHFHHHITCLCVRNSRLNCLPNYHCPVP